MKTKKKKSKNKLVITKQKLQMLGFALEMAVDKFNHAQLALNRSEESPNTDCDKLRDTREAYMLCVSELHATYWPILEVIPEKALESIVEGLPFDNAKEAIESAQLFFDCRV